MILRPCLRRLASSSATSHPAAFRLPPTINRLLASTETSADSDTAVSGWIKSIRKQKNVAFAVITDGSSSKGLQAVLIRGKDNDASIRNLTNGTAVRLTGRIVPSPGSEQSHELLVDETQHGKVHVLGECSADDYPIQKKSLTTEYLRDHAHLRARTAHIAAMIRLRNHLGRRIGAWFEEQGFCYAHTPVLTGNDAEGAGEAFRIAHMDGEPSATSLPSSASPPSSPSTPIEFFSRPAFLTVSHQLHLEALATALSRVYTLSPCFRAERSLTGRHLAEFWMLEAEWAFLGEQGVEEVCRFVEGCLRSVVGDLLGTEKLGAREDVDELWKFGDENKRKALTDAFQSDKPWVQMSYTDAVKALEKQHTSNKFEFEPAWGRPLQSEHERWIAEEFVGGPTFITDYPASIKPFYMRLNNDGKTVACFDLVVPYVGELVGGSVREERVDFLKEAMIKAGLDMDHSKGTEGGYAWYEELRRWGGAPHAGFGMGFERLIGWVGGIENVRECVPMPRWAGRMLL